MNYFYLALILGTTLSFGETLKNNSDWKEKEEMAKNIHTPTEQLMLLKEEKNPFIKKALLSNIKYKKIENKDILKVQENRAIFDIKMMSVKKDLDDIDEKLSRLLFFLKHRKSFDENRVAQFQKQLSETNEDYTKIHTKRNEEISKVYSFKEKQIEEKIIKYQNLIQDQSNEFRSKLESFINLEKQKAEKITDKLEMRTKISSDNLKQVSTYLNQIDKSLFFIKEAEIDKELIDTVNPELIALKEIYVDRINKIQNKMNLILLEKNRTLKDIENDSIMKIQNNKKSKILEVESELKEKYIKSKYLYLQKELEFKKQLELEKLKLSNEKSLRKLAIETNDLNLKIFKNTKTYDELSKQNKEIAENVKTVKQMLSNFRELKTLVIKKANYFEEIVKSSDSTIQEKIMVASNKGTHPDLLIELSRSPFWSVREAVAMNSNTPTTVLSELLEDKNLFVKTKAKLTLDGLKSAQK